MPDLPFGDPLGDRDNGMPFPVMDSGAKYFRA